MDVVELVAFLGGVTFALAAALAVVANRRVGLILYVAEYLGVASLLYVTGFPAGAWTRVGVALAVGTILWLTLVRLGWAESAAVTSAIPSGRGFRLSAASLVAVAAWGLGSSVVSVLPVPTIGHARAAVALLAFGLLQLGLSEDPIRWIYALGSCLLGFEAAYAVLEPSLAIQAILASIHLGVVVVGADIALRRHPPPVEAAGP